MAQTGAHSIATGLKRVSRRHILSLAGLGALAPGAALIGRLRADLAPPAVAGPSESMHPLEIVQALPLFSTASIVGRRSVARTDAGSQTPAAYLYYQVHGEASWPAILSFYERTLSALGWAVRRNKGKLGGLGFNKAGYSGFLAATHMTNQNVPASYYLFLGTVS